MKQTINKWLVGFLSLFLLVNILGASFTFINPSTIEEKARVYIAEKIEERVMEEVNKVLPNLESDTLSRGLNVLGNVLGDELDGINAFLDGDLRQSILSVVEGVCVYDCDSRSLIVEAIINLNEDRAIELSNGLNNIESFIKGEYYVLIEKILLDLRIFFVTNAIIFGLILLAYTGFRERKMKLTVVINIAILSTLTCILFYIFRDSWFYTILFDNYWGYAYVTYNVLLFAFLMDIIFNKARVTDVIMSVIGTALDRIFSN